MTSEDQKAMEPRHHSWGHNWRGYAKGVGGNCLDAGHVNDGACYDCTAAALRECFRDCYDCTAARILEMENVFWLE